MESGRAIISYPQYNPPRRSNFIIEARTVLFEPRGAWLLVCQYKIMIDHTKKFFIYTRKSTDDKDRQVRSISDQLAELKSLALKEQLEVVDVFVEKQTAKIPGRPVFNEMIERMERGEASGILAWHPDRLARNSVDGGKIIYLVDTGVILEMKFPTFWFDPTPQGKFMLSIAFSQSKYYVDNLSENIKREFALRCRIK